MTALLAAVATGVVLLALLTGAAAHLSRPATLPDALAAHRVLPARAVRPAALAVTAAEALLAPAVTAAALAGQRPALAAVLAVAAALFAAYARYTRHALATGRGGPCGCSRAEVPLSAWVVARAWAFAGLAALGAALVAGPATPPDGGAAWAVAATASVALGASLWVLPAAMTQPAERFAHVGAMAAGPFTVTGPAGPAKPAEAGPTPQAGPGAASPAPDPTPAPPAPPATSASVVKGGR